MHIAKLGRRLFQKDDRYSWKKHFSMVREVRAWEAKVARQYPVLERTNGEVTAYVANFLRPQNIQPIVRSLLACDSIGSVVVSNNNPACPLEKWLKISLERLSVLSHDEPQSCSMRYMHIRSLPGKMFLIIDDDLFLEPPQIEMLCSFLKKDPSVPHGIYGQRWEGERLTSSFQREEGRVPILNRVYAFTAEHAAEFFRLAHAIGMEEGSEKWKLSNFDDMILSFSGSSLPYMHDVGPIVDCPSQGKKDVATWRNEKFHFNRNETFLKLQSARLLSA